jgi:hypothetical protein
MCLLIFYTTQLSSLRISVTFTIYYDQHADTMLPYTKLTVHNYRSENNFTLHLIRKWRSNTDCNYIRVTRLQSIYLFVRLFSFKFNRYCKVEITYSVIELITSSGIYKNVQYTAIQYASTYK